MTNPDKIVSVVCNSEIMLNVDNSNLNRFSLLIILFVFKDTETWHINGIKSCSSLFQTFGSFCPISNTAASTISLSSKKFPS